MCDLFTGRTADSRRLIVDDMREICHRPLAEGGLGLRADTSSLHPGDRITCPDEARKLGWPAEVEAERN